MLQKSKAVVLALLPLAFALTPASAAEREDVRKVINLVTSVKMPYPESLARSRAKTERVWLERLLRTWSHAAWLNPVPENHWSWTTSTQNVQRIMEGRMFPVTVAGLEKAMKSLA